MKKNNFGFTLIELLVVIAIIGILVTIVIVAINPVKLINDAKDSKNRANLNQIKAAMQIYYNDCKAYPPTLPTGVWDGTDFAVTCDDNSTYMKQVPNDNGTAYPYAVQPGGCTTACTDYVVGANLNTQTADDLLTITKCSAPVPAGTHNFRVCND